MISNCTDRYGDERTVCKRADAVLKCNSRASISNREGSQYVRGLPSHFSLRFVNLGRLLPLTIQQR